MSWQPTSISTEREIRYVDNHHTEGGDEEHFATADFVDQERASNCNYPSPDTKSAVDLKLLLLICNTNLIEDFGEVVGDDGVAGPLREEAKSDEDQETVTIAFGFEEFKDAVPGKLFFEGECRFDFTLNELDSDVVCVIESIVMCEDP